MESTLKIDYQSRGKHFAPIIKIVQPIRMSGQPSDEEFDDPKDKLISNFLHTPCILKGNFIFEVHSRDQHPSDNPRVIITTISAIEEDNLFRRLKSYIMDRIISWEDINACHELQQTKPDSNYDHIQNVPLGFDKYQKIEEFFAWLSKQDYWDNTTIKSEDSYPSQTTKS